jgi:hypothetical protein
MIKKKAQGLSLQVIIIAAISLVVLIILIIIFRQQISIGSKRYLDIGQSAEDEVKGEKCTSFITARQCSTDAPSEDFEWVDVGKKDCKEGSCWERGEKKEK